MTTKDLQPHARNFLINEFEEALRTYHRVENVMDFAEELRQAGVDYALLNKAGKTYLDEIRRKNLCRTFDLLTTFDDWPYNWSYFVYSWMKKDGTKKQDIKTGERKG